MDVRTACTLSLKNEQRGPPIEYENFLFSLSLASSSLRVSVAGWIDLAFSPSHSSPPLLALDVVYLDLEILPATYKKST